MRLPRRHGGRGALPCPPSFTVLDHGMQVGTKGNTIRVLPEMYLTLSLRCEIEPPSNAASGKSAGTGHDAQRAPYRHWKAVRRHSPRPPPAESPAHFGSIARHRRGNIRLGIPERILNLVPGMTPRGAAASRLAVASHQSSDVPSPGTSCWFGRVEGTGHTIGGSIPAVASRRTEPGARHEGIRRTDDPNREEDGVEPTDGMRKARAAGRGCTWSAIETET